MMPTRPTELSFCRVFSNLRERLYSTSAPSQAVMFGAVRQCSISDWYNFLLFVKFKKRFLEIALNQGINF